MKCIHTAITPLNEGEWFGPHKPFELCLSDDNVLVMDFVDHDGGGIVFGPESVERLRKFFAARQK